MLEKALKELGLNDKEIEVYLTILKHGKLKPADVAKQININRTTVYSVAKELIKKGLIFEDLGSPAHYLVANDPKDILRLIDKEEESLFHKKELAGRAIKELSQLALSAELPIPRIRFIEEKLLEKFLYDQTDKWNDSVKKYDDMWWGFQDRDFAENYKSWIVNYWKIPSSQKVGGRLLTNQFLAETEIRKRSSSSRITKYWDQPENFTGTLWIVGDYIIMIVSKDNPHYLVEIYDKVLAHNLREVFKQLWKKIPEN
jgi:sugar-specific transcriptional regulator TrmB